MWTTIEVYAFYAFKIYTNKKKIERGRGAPGAPVLDHCL